MKLTRTVGRMIGRKIHTTLIFLVNNKTNIFLASPKLT